ncbi:MAG: hypothetical protein J6Q52_02955 [Clostridia bacterium]|nr:hypothetical protein [Clostridia bacterium]
MRKTISFLVGLLMGIILTLGSIIGIPLYLLNSKSLSDVEDMTGADLGLFEDQEDVDGVMDMSILSLIGYTAGLLEGDENGKLTLEDLSTKLGFSSQLPTEFQQLYTLDLKSMSENPDQVSEIIMDSITVDMIMSMSKLDANDGSFGSMLAGISDMSLSSVLGGVDNLPIGIIAGITPNEYYAEDSAIVTYYKNHIGYTTPVVSEQPDDLNDLLRKLLFKADDNGEYIAYIQPTRDGAYAYLKYEMLHVTNDTARYDLVDGEYKLLKSPDLTDANLYVKVRGNYLSVEDATALYVLYASAPRYNATDISAMSDMQSVVGDLTLGDLASLMGLEQMALLESLMGYTIDELGSSPDVFEDIEIATLLGDEIADTMLSNILLKKMTTIPSIGDKVWVDIAGVKTYIQLNSDNIDDYSEYYQSITLGELSDGGFSDMTLAQLMPEVDDELLLKVLYRELDSDYKCREGEIVYYRDDDGKMIEIVCQDSASIPDGETIYKALTISELTSGGIDINSIVQDLEVAGFLGEEISDTVMKNILFTKTTPPNVGDEIWVDVEGVMKLVPVDQGILDTYSVFYRSLTIGELADSSFEDITLATFVPNVDNEVLLKVLYREKESGYQFEKGEVFYVKDTDGKMKEITYQDSTSIPDGEKLYLAVTLGELSNGIDMEAILSDIQIATLLGDEIADEMLSKILFKKTSTPLIGEKTWVEVDGVMTLVKVDQDILSAYTTYYRAITVSELTDEDMSNMTLATFMPDVTDDILLKVLYREVESGYVYSEGKTIYYRGDDGKMVEVVFCQDSDSIPEGEKVYKALTFSEFIDEGIDVESILQEIELAPLMGESGVSDSLFIEIMFDRVDNNTLSVCDEVYRLESGVMKPYVIKDNSDLAETNKYFKSKTVSQLMNMQLENLEIVKFVSNSADDLIVAILYDKVDTSTLTNGDTVYYKSGGVMVEAEYTHPMRDMSLYKGVSIKDFGSVNITERVKNLSVVEFLSSDGKVTDETLIELIFEEIPAIDLEAMNSEDVVYHKGEDGMHETTKGELDAINSTESEDSRYTAYKSMTLLDFASLDMSAKVKEIEIARYLADPEGKVSGDLIVKMLFRQVDSEYLSSLGKYDKVYIKSEGAMKRVSKDEVDGQTVYRSLTMSELSNIDIKSIVDDMQLVDLLDIQPDTMLAKIFMAEYSGELVAGDYYYVEDGKYVKYTYPSDLEPQEGTALYVALSVSDMSNKMENLLIIDIVDVEPNTLMSALAYEELEEEDKVEEGTTYYYIQGNEYVHFKYTGDSNTLPEYPLYRPRAVNESAAASENLLVRDVINVKPDSLMSNVAYAEVDVLEPGHTYYYRKGDEYVHFKYTGKENYSQVYRAEKMKDMPDRMANLTLTDVLGEPKSRNFYGDGKEHYTSIWAIFEKEEDGKTTIDDIKLADLEDQISTRINVEKITLGTLERLQGKAIEGLEDSRNIPVKDLIDFYIQYKNIYTQNKDTINNLP